jgi:ubiquinone biosynthesis monooxygenase Coq7
MTSTRYLPGDKTSEEELASIIRVNHAGEYGARRIYKGQLAVLKKHKQIQEMYEQELEHLQYFETQIAKHRIRPTIMQPLWHVFGWTLGAVTAALGEKAAMACTVAVEEVIGEHYTSQLDVVKKYPEQKALYVKIAKFRDDELEHRDTGLKHDAEATFAYGALSTVIKGFTKSAIWLSKRI